MKNYPHFPALFANKPVITAIVAIAALGLTACEKAEPPKIYDSGPVIRRDIVVAVEAAGIIEPSLTVEVKSKASGEILRIDHESGDRIEQGTLLVQIDKRAPSNQLAQASAELEAAIARRGIAEAQMKRAKTLLESRTINDVDYEQTILEHANAKADVIRSEVAVENARIALDDANVRAPITGTIIEKLVEKGQVISSPTMDVGGGTLLLKMANLSSVQVKALVDESDIGKIRPDQPVTVTVAAFPNQPFEGVVSKIEPQALAEQTVTTFSVLIILDNEAQLLRPGMNADVEIRIAERRDVVAVPTAALRTKSDVNISSELVGLSAADVNAMLQQDTPAAAGKRQAGPGGSGDVAGSTRSGGSSPGGRDATKPAGSGGGRGDSGAARARGSSGGWGGGSGSRKSARKNDRYRFEGRYWVFVDGPSGPRAINVVTGLTDLDYSEVVSGLEEGDRVLLLPSSGLILAQKRLQAQMSRFSTLPGMGTKKDDKKKPDNNSRR